MKNKGAQIIFHSGGGYYTYMMGIAQYLYEYYELSNCYMAGTSAGVFSAFSLAADISPKTLFSSYVIPHLKLVSTYTTKALFNWKSVTKKVLRQVDKELLTESGYTKACKKLNIGVFCLNNFEFKYANNFTTRKEMFQFINASYTIPFLLTSLCDCVEKIEDKCYIDGGFQINNSCLPQNPSHYMPIHIKPDTFRKSKLINHLVFTDQNLHEEQFRKGYEDAKANPGYFQSLPLRSRL
jgi:predicted patatin/cPLA2 family phospholipase